MDILLRCVPILPIHLISVNGVAHLLWQICYIGKGLKKASRSRLASERFFQPFAYMTKA
jgi:hypothetical protein